MDNPLRSEGTREKGRLYVICPNGDEVDLYRWEIAQDCDAVPVEITSKVPALGHPFQNTLRVAP